MGPSDSDRDPACAWEERRWRAGVEKVRAGRSRVAVPRILVLLRRHGIRASFFVPAVVAILHPDEQRRVADEGHELAMHGWIHETTSQLTPAVERDLMQRAYETLAKIAGRPPVGVRCPSWDFNPATLGLIRELGPSTTRPDGRRRAL